LEQRGQRAYLQIIGILRKHVMSIFFWFRNGAVATPSLETGLAAESGWSLTRRGCAPACFLAEEARASELRLPLLPHGESHPALSRAVARGPHADLIPSTIKIPTQTSPWDVAVCCSAVIFGARCMRKERGGNPQIEGLNQGRRRDVKIPKSN
jgi:hypothetical protein